MDVTCRLNTKPKGLIYASERDFFVLTAHGYAASHGCAVSG